MIAKNSWITMCSFFVAIMMTLLYPLINYVMVNAVESLLETIKCIRISKEKVNSNVICKYQRYVITLIAACLCIILNSVLNSQTWSNIYSVLLTISLLFICYVLPCLIYLKTEKQWCQKSAISAIFIVIVCTVLMFGGTIVIVQGDATNL